MAVLVLCGVACVFMIAGPILCWKHNDKPLLWIGSLTVGEMLAFGLFIDFIFFNFS